MRIGKLAGAIISLLIMSVYVYYYQKWIKNLPYSFQLTCFFFLGIFLHFLRKIEAGTTAELLFFEKSTNYFWSDGFCLVPSLFPALHNIGIYLLWNLKKETYEELQLFNPNIKIEHTHFRDQRLPEYKIKTDASLLSMTIYRIFANLGNWFFSIDRSHPELVYQRIGFKIILLAVIYGFIANSWINLPFNQQKKTSHIVYAQLDDGTIQPPLPNKEMFEEDVVKKYTDLDGFRFLHYQKTINGKKPFVLVDSPVCLIIPAGKRLAFESKKPPKLVINMTRNAEYVAKEQYASLLGKILSKTYNFTANMFANKPVQFGYPETKAWKYAQTFWDKIDFEGYAVVATAKDLEDIPDGVTGGFICF